MGPTAVSEVTEQIARIIFILVGSYLALNVFNGTILQANGIATFAAAMVLSQVSSHYGTTGLNVEEILNRWLNLILLI